MTKKPKDGHKGSLTIGIFGVKHCENINKLLTTYLKIYTTKEIVRGYLDEQLSQTTADNEPKTSDTAQRCLNVTTLSSETLESPSMVKS